jgi:hypothetical protein
VTDQSAQRGVCLIRQRVSHSVFVLGLMQTHLDELVVGERAADGCDYRFGDALVPYLHERPKGVRLAAQLAPLFG